MEKYTIKSIVKVAEDKAVVRYVRGTSSKVVKSNRALYEKDGVDSVNFKGIRLAVRFDANGIAQDIQVKEIYDEKVKQEEPNRAERIIIEIDNKEGLDVQRLKVEVQKALPNPNEQPKPQQQGVVKHYRFDEIKTCVEADLPVYLYGPAGSGKNHVLQQIAEELGLEFYFTNSVQQEFKLTGFIDAGGNFHETEFYKAFTQGGLFFLDELDASIPEVLVLLNAAIANRYFEFPNGKVNAHPDFRVVAAGNTVGTGADEQYTGRMQIDQSTLDRFVMIDFDYDRNIELAIAKGNVPLVEFIRNLRDQAKAKGINATFSYRTITMVTKLEGKMDLKRILEIAVIRGIDSDTLQTFDTTPNNMYSKALWAIKQKRRSA